MIKFIHTGDIHLGLQFNSASFSGKKAMERRRELWQTFQDIVNYAINYKVDFLFICGDLYEDEYFTLADITRIRDILKEASNVNIVIVAGNHDVLNNKSLYKRVEWSPNVSIFDNFLSKKEFKELDTVVYGYSWDKVEIRENRLFKDFYQDESAKNKILLLHGDLNNESNYLPLSLDELLSLNMDYIALGHIHKPRIFNDKIAYCGCPEPLDFGETGERGFIEGVIDRGDTRIKFIPFSKRVFHIVDKEINGELGYQDILNMILGIDKGEINKDFYRVNINGYLQRDISLDDIKESLKEEFYHIEIIDKTTPDFDLEALLLDNENNIIGRFIETMKDKGLEDPVVRDALYIGLNVLLKERS